MHPRSSITDLSKVLGNGNDNADTTAAELPASYRQALDQLSSPHNNTNHRHDNTANKALSALSDEEHLALVKEVLSNFYATKDQWVTAGEWTAREAKLDPTGQLAGSAADELRTAVPFTLASSVVDYLCTLIKALEWKLGGETPELL
eukprot:CAMPEP_0183733320 /NCGR_PEP_ID=MMETSP0737-20130205/40822_1 /TAXON_ID=385413 /ORGANISM="Thalassiosira miniscula, Strain CCMP1093" /LENGTH=146 /DNA_ID=CAMNT_0025966553 /DNA_START=149 /DNA_END=585 /DNA_ORIENTATION=+